MLKASIMKKRHRWKTFDRHEYRTLYKEQAFSYNNNVSNQTISDDRNDRDDREDSQKDET